MIKIGVSACFFYPNPKRAVFGKKTLMYLERDMARYLSRGNVLPILIPDLKEDLLQPILKELDGFVLQGGIDISPESYGEIPVDPSRWEVDLSRDQYEIKIIDYAIQSNKPLLGICRGCQMINVYFGGTLFQDIETHIPGALTHRDAEKYDSHTHDIIINPEGVLNTIYPNIDHPIVNSIHHQGIKSLGKGLIVEATSVEDQVIEAISANSGRILGVQWHPEFSHTKRENVIDPFPLIDYFLKGIHS